MTYKKRVEVLEDKIARIREILEIPEETIDSYTRQENRDLKERVTFLESLRGTKSDLWFRGMLQTSYNKFSSFLLTIKEKYDSIKRGKKT